MACEKLSQWDRPSLVEKDAHLGGSQGAARGMFQDSADLVHAHPWEPLDKLGDLGSSFQIFEQGGHGHAGTAEDPRPADAGRVALDHRTCRPVDHGQRILLASCCMLGRRLSGILQVYACFLPVFGRLCFRSVGVNGLICLAFLERDERGGGLVIPVVVGSNPIVHPIKLRIVA